MVSRFVETLLVTIGNRVSRRWASRGGEGTAPERQADIPSDHVVIGHVIPDTASNDDAIATELLRAGIVALAPQARRRHIYTLGASGTGKTNLLLNLIESDIRNRRAFCVVDLRGDLIDRILPRLAAAAPAEEWRRRLLVLDLRREEQVVGFNPLAGEGDPYARAMLLLDVLKKQSDSFGVQLEETLRNALIALALTGWSLLEIEPLLTNGAFRAEVLAAVQDPHIQSFFARYDKLTAAAQTAQAMAVLNKVTPLLAIPRLRLLFGQRQSFSFGELLDNEPGMVILISLAVDRLHHAAHLTGGLLISAFQAAMMARVDQAERDRVPVTLYCDEFEMMASDRFSEIVAEGRRFGVGLCLSHQNLTQLSPTLGSVLRNNVHTQIYFQTGAGDAAELAREITGDQSREEIRRTLMAQGTGEAYLVRRGQASLRIRTLLSPDPQVTASEVAALSSTSFASYARPMAEVEHELAERIKQFHALEETARTTPAAPVYEIRHSKTKTFKPRTARVEATESETDSESAKSGMAISENSGPQNSGPENSEPENSKPEKSHTEDATPPATGSENQRQRKSRKKSKKERSKHGGKPGDH